MEQRLKRESPGSNFVWCADIQKRVDGPLYVDQVHYSPGLSEVLAERIADVIVKSTLSSLLQVTNVLLKIREMNGACREETRM